MGVRVRGSCPELYPRFARTDTVVLGRAAFEPRYAQPCPTTGLHRSVLCCNRCLRSFHLWTARTQHWYGMGLGVLLVLTGCKLRDANRRP